MAISPEHLTSVIWQDYCESKPSVLTSIRCRSSGTKRDTEAIEIIRKEGLSIPVRALNCETIGGYISKSTKLVEI
jgi:hypothetical protein